MRPGSRARWKKFRGQLSDRLNVLDVLASGGEDVVLEVLRRHPSVGFNGVAAWEVCAPNGYACWVPETEIWELREEAPRG